MTTQDCENLHPLLSLYLEDKLSAREKSRVAGHLAECIEAQTQVEEYRALRRLLLATPEPIPPSDFHERILEYVYEKQAAPLVSGDPSSSPWRGRRVLWGLAAAVLGMALFFNMFSNWREVVRKSAAPSVKEASEEPRSDLSSGTAPSAPPVASAPQATESQLVSSAQARSSKPRRAAKVWSFQEEVDDQDPFEANQSLFASQVSNRALRSEAGVQNVAYGDAPAAEQVSVPESQAQPVVRKPAARRAASKTKSVVVAAVPADLPIVEPTGPYPGGAADDSKTAEEARRWSGSQGPYPAEHTEWVQDSTALMAYWQLLSSGQPMPQVDFQKEGVALIFMGTRPTAGYAVSVEGVQEGPDAVTLLWHEKTPPTDASSAQVQTRPWAMQVVPHGSKPVIFLKR